MDHKRARISHLSLSTCYKTEVLFQCVLAIPVSMIELKKLINIGQPGGVMVPRQDWDLSDPVRSREGHRGIVRGVVISRKNNQIYLL
jgi:hypothetical protein